MAKKWVKMGHFNISLIFGVFRHLSGLCRKWDKLIAFRQKWVIHCWVILDPLLCGYYLVMFKFKGSIIDDLHNLHK